MMANSNYLEAIKVQQIKDLVSSIEKDFTPDILLAIQRMLQKALEHTESASKNAFNGASDAKQANKDNIIMALKNALDKNKQAHYLLLEVVDAIKSVKYSL